MRTRARSLRMVIPSFGQFLFGLRDEPAREDADGIPRPDREALAVTAQRHGGKIVGTRPGQIDRDLAAGRPAVTPEPAADDGGLIRSRRSGSGGVAPPE